MNRVESGIEGLDKLIYGGFPVGRSYLLSGEPGTGKTIFSLQYLLEGIKKEEPCIYISIDERPEHVISDANSLGWDLHPHLNNGLLKILDITSYFSRAHQDDGSFEISKIIDHIKGFVQEYKAKRMVIDPISPIVFGHKTYPKLAEYIKKLIFEIETDLGCTTILTSYIPVGSAYFSQHGIEEYATSGIILLRLLKLNNKHVRTLLVRKMRGTRIDLSEYSFDILPDRGIVLRQAL